jgi:hypothetical protein
MFLGRTTWKFMALGLIPLGVWVLPADSGATTAPSVQAVPSTNVADGQLITVSGTGFSPSATIAVIECQTGATSESGCDLSTYETINASTTGSFSTPFIASRYLHVSNPTPITVDCSVAAACILAAANFSNYSEAASTPLTFDPSARPPPSLVFGAMLSPTGTVDHKTGVATVSGTVTCNRPVFASVDGQLNQIYHRFIFTSYFSLNVLCTGSTPWNAVVQPTNGLFGKGAASVSAYASGFVDGTGNQVELSGPITLQFAKS